MINGISPVTGISYLSLKNLYIAQSVIVNSGGPYYPYFPTLLSKLSNDAKINIIRRDGHFIGASYSFKRHSIYAQTKGLGRNINMIIFGFSPIKRETDIGSKFSAMV